MIPTFNCAQYLRQTLESVLSQDKGLDQMQITVIDDVSTSDDPEAVVVEVGRGRIEFYRKDRNEGAVANFNTCLERSRGQLVHILHGDDYVLPGFYDRIQQLSSQHPNAGLLASRSFVVDEKNLILGVTPLLAELNTPTRDQKNFHLKNPLQFPGVVVRRASYEAHGGFNPRLSHTADWEMWSRIIGNDGGVVLGDVLACYREFAGNDTSRLRRTADNLRDRRRCYNILAERCDGFETKNALKYLQSVALWQAEEFADKGDVKAYCANLDFWSEITPLWRRLRTYAGRFVRRVVGQ